MRFWSELLAFRDRAGEDANFERPSSAREFAAFRVFGGFFSPVWGSVRALWNQTCQNTRIWSRNNDCLPEFRFSNQSIKFAVLVISKDILF